MSRVQRSQMAVFLLKTLLGADYNAPNRRRGPSLRTSPADSFAADWIEDLATRGD